MDQKKLGMVLGKISALEKRIKHLETELLIRDMAWEEGTKYEPQVKTTGE